MERSTPEILQDLLKKGAPKGPCGKMCGDCAFKMDQPHTIEFLYAAELALIQLMTEGTFYCHADDHKTPNGICQGYLMAKRAYSIDEI